MCVYGLKSMFDFFSLSRWNSRLDPRSVFGRSCCPSRGSERWWPVSAWLLSTTCQGINTVDIKRTPVLFRCRPTEFNSYYKKDAIAHS